MACSFAEYVNDAALRARIGYEGPSKCYPRGVRLHKGGAGGLWGAIGTVVGLAGRAGGPLSRYGPRAASTFLNTRSRGMTSSRRKLYSI